MQKSDFISKTQGGGGGGGKGYSDIFISTQARSIFKVFRKMNIFGGMKILSILFIYFFFGRGGGGGHCEIALNIGKFYVF